MRHIQNRIIRLATAFPDFFSNFPNLISICCRAVMRMPPELVSGETFKVGLICEDGGINLVPTERTPATIYCI